MKGASWVELSSPTAIAGPKCETPNMPRKAQKNAAVCTSEFHVELSSRLASDYASISSGDEASIVRHGFSSPHDEKVKEYHEISFGNKESDLEHEVTRGEEGDKGDEKDVLTLFLCAAQAACGGEKLRDSSSVEPMEAEVLGRQYMEDFIDEGPRPIWGTGFQGAVPRLHSATLTIREGLPGVDLVQQDEASNEGKGPDRGKIIFQLPEADGVARDGVVRGGQALIEEGVAFDLPGELSAELSTALPTEPATDLSDELSDELSEEPSGELSTELHVLHAESRAKGDARLLSASFREPSSHEEAGAANSGRHVISHSECDSFQHEKGDLVTYGIRDTESLLRYDSRYHGTADKIEQEAEAAFFLNSDEVQHQGIKSFGKPVKVGNWSPNEPKDVGEAHLTDNENELLFPKDMSVTLKTREYPVESHVSPGEVRETTGGEKRMPDITREVALASGDKHRPIGGGKARPMRDIDKPRPNPTTGVPHGICEEVVSEDGISNVSERYPEPNQRALRSSIINQIVDKAELWLGRGQARMVIDLKPDILGRVHLKVSSEAGRVVAEIRVESAGTKALIESGLSDLKTALSEKGFSFDAFTVSWNSSRDSGGTGLGSNGLPWFSESNDRGHHSHFAQAGAVTSAVGGEDVTSLAGAFGVRTYLDYIA